MSNISKIFLKYIYVENADYFLASLLSESMNTNTPILTILKYIPADKTVVKIQSKTIFVGEFNPN